MISVKSKLLKVREIFASNGDNNLQHILAVKCPLCATTVVVINFGVKTFAEIHLKRIYQYIFTGISGIACVPVPTGQ